MTTNGNGPAAVQTEPFNVLIDPRVAADGVTQTDLQEQFDHNMRMRELVNSVVPSVVSVKTSKKISLRRQTQLDPFEFFFPRSRRGGSPEESLVQNSLGSGVVVTEEGPVQRFTI